MKVNIYSVAKYWSILLSLLLLAGCAQTVFVMDATDGGKNISPRVWPQPPEIARYRYVGELTGENNFQSGDGVSKGTATRFLEWLVGLAGINSQPQILMRPQTGVVDADGRIFVTDVGRGGVYVFDKPAGKLEIWDIARGADRFETPVGIALGAGNEILVADADLHAVFRLDKSGKPVGEFGRDILIRPTGLARDAKRGRIYVADTHAHDIKVFDDDGNLMKIMGKRGEGDGEFNFPTHLAFAADKLYVTDTLNSRIQIFDAEGRMIGKFGRRGLNVGDLVRPKGVAVDSAGDIYVVESLHDYLLVFDEQGRILMAVGGSGNESGEFSLPSGVWVDNQDRVYIADMYNGRVTVLQYLGAQH